MTKFDLGIDKRSLRRHIIASSLHCLLQFETTLVVRREARSDRLFIEGGYVWLMAHNFCLQHRVQGVLSAYLLYVSKRGKDFIGTWACIHFRAEIICSVDHLLHVILQTHLIISDVSDHIRLIHVRGKALQVFASQVVAKTGLQRRVKCRLWADAHRVCVLVTHLF